MAAKNAKTQKNDRLAKRLSFAKSPEPIELPDLLSLQTESFDWLVGNDAWKARLDEAQAALEAGGGFFETPGGAQRDAAVRIERDIGPHGE